MGDVPTQIVLVVVNLPGIRHSPNGMIRIALPQRTLESLEPIFYLPAIRPTVLLPEEVCRLAHGLLKTWVAGKLVSFILK